ncbi:WXG100 family type VII secretion target [Paenibacillus sp. GCM10028914]|uniref:WXG100 family type VII secretion target n=1 Tax=Paenibacillus sp. GCM10028914 TaxID=3273416 RepID=UPI00360687C1
MSKILVPPEVLMQVAEKFRLESLQMEWRISSLDHQMDTMLMWEGTTRQNFFDNYKKARSDMTKTIEHMTSISDELKAIADRFKLVDEELLPLALVGSKEEPKGWMEETWDSLKELGNGIMAASNERYDKRYSSVWSFLDYWTAGIPKGAYQGYVERADKLFDSRNDFANGMTFGIHGTIREAILPKNAWSTEHVANMIGAAGIVAGVTVPLMRPKDVLSPSVKYDVGNGKKGLKHDSGGDGGGAPKRVEGPGEGTSKATNSSAISEYVSEVEKLQRPYDHLVNVDGIKRGGRPGITGGHNIGNFYKALEEDANKYGLNVERDYIVGVPKKHSIEGIYEVEYQIPSLQRNELDRSIFEPIKDSEGNVVGKRVNDPKTVYDPNIISDEKMYNWGKAALEPQIHAGNVKNGIVKGELNGLKFIGFVDENGKVKNFYPTFDFRN